ncbi:MAG: twin-arginine translocase subunit TatC [Tannerella sp.]|jgi:sec-independent protein translocase protein TatC|nr:twin-arginine translocase subunit TatC [Tannerella sp.]
MSQSQEEMSFWDHLEELRWTLFRCIFALLIFTVGGFLVMRYLFDQVIMAPCSSDFVTYRWMCNLAVHLPFFPDFCDEAFHVDVVQIKLATQFFTHMSSSFWLAVVLTFPYLMYEVWRFIRPALYDNEQKSVRWVFSLGTLMFFIGCFVGYMIVFPMTLRFLATYELSSAITEQVSLESYMDTFLMMIFIMGVVFEMPLLSWLLSQIGLINRSFFRKYRRYAIVGLLIAAAFITPSGDPFTLSVVFLPLYALYELSAFFVKPAPVETLEELQTT